MAGEGQDNANPELARLFERYRPLLFSIAYSIVGIVADAQELTQETLRRWLQCPDHDASNARIFLVTTVTAACIDYLQHTETSQDDIPALSEPGGDSCRCPLSEYAADNSASTTVLTLLSHLTPTERVVFLLEAIFKYDYSQIAQATGKDEAQCRETGDRVKAFIRRNRTRADSNSSLYVSQI